MEFIRSKKSAHTLDMAPMIDIVFQLLIFFMLSSSFLTPSIKLALPQAVRQDDREPERIVVSVDKSGNTYLNTAKIPLEELGTRLAMRLNREPEKAVHLRGDRDMPYRYFVQVMDIARRSGARQIHILHETARASDPGLPAGEVTL